MVQSPSWEGNWFAASQENLLTYLLIYYMVQSPSWEGNLFAASQENLLTYSLHAAESFLSS